MKHFITTGLLLCSLFAVAQGRVNVQKDIDIRAGSLFYTVGGVPVVTAEFYDVVEGSPFFKEEWLNSVLVLKNNATIKNIPLKLDLVKGNVHYLDQYGGEFIAETYLKEIVLEDTVLNKNYRFVHTSGFLNHPVTKNNSWLLWLVSGKASLYKKFNKNVSEQKRYGSATLEQRIQTSEHYVVFVNDQLKTVKKLKELPNILVSHKKQISEFIAAKSLAALSTDEQFATTIEYYNSLL